MIEIKVSFIPPVAEHRGRVSACKRITMQELAKAQYPRQRVGDIAVKLLDSIKDLDEVFK